MTVNELKRYIYEESKIEYILEQIGCHDIKLNRQKEYFSAAQPDGDNPQGVNIRNNEYLNYRSFSRNISFEDGKDLISLVEEIKCLSFLETVKFLHELLGLEFTMQRKQEKKKKLDPLGLFKKIRDKTKYGAINVDDIHVLDEELLNDYMPLLHIDFFREGIMPWTREKFNLAYSYRYKRMVIPHRYWATGELVGFNMRTMVENWKEFGIKKYILTSGYNKHLNLYGLWDNYESIQKAGYVVVAESEKSVLKRDSLGDGTVVALSGKTLSDEQVRILIGLNVEIIFAMDNDMDINEIRFMCEKFKNIRKVSYIRDSWDILGKKDAPMDASNKNYLYLFKNRIVYNNEEHEKYLRSLNK